MDNLTFVFLGGDPNVDVGPVISPQSKKRIHEIVQSAIDEGATLYLDGRDATVAGYEKGNFIGPTIITDVKVRFLKIIFGACCFDKKYSIS